MKHQIYKFNDKLDTLCYLDDLAYVRRSAKSTLELIIRMKYHESDMVLLYGTYEEVLEDYDKLMDMMDTNAFTTLYFNGLIPHIIMVEDITLIAANEDLCRVSMNDRIYSVTSISINTKTNTKPIKIYYTDSCEMYRDFKLAAKITKTNERGN